MTMIERKLLYREEFPLVRLHIWLDSIMFTIHQLCDALLGVRVV